MKPNTSNNDKTLLKMFDNAMNKRFGKFNWVSWLLGALFGLGLGLSIGRLQ